MREYRWVVEFCAREKLKKEDRKKLREDLLVAVYKAGWDNMEIGLRGFPKVRCVRDV